MFKKLLIPLLFIGLHPSLAQDLQIDEVVKKSQEFYNSHPNGSINVNISFKSSIAESVSQTNASYTFCNRDEKVQSVAGQTVVYMEKNKYLIADLLTHEYLDMSGRKEMAEQRTGRLNSYPQFNKEFFVVFREKGWKINTSDSLIHIFDNSDHYYFSKIDFSIVRHQSFSIDVTGFQVKDWRIITQDYTPTCNTTQFIADNLKEYKKVKTFTGKKQTINLIGKSIWNIIDTSQLILDKGDRFSSARFQGRYLYVDVFYQSCMPCIQLFKEIKTLYPYVDKGRLAIIGVDPILEDSASMPKFKTRYKLQHPILTGNQARMIDHIVNPEGIYPFILIVDLDGIIKYVFRGYGEKNGEKVKKLLERN